MSEYTPYQKKVIKNYYDNLDSIKLQRLAELVGELYLATGKKQDRAWQSAATTMQQLGIPQSRVDHLIKQRRPELIAELVKELQAASA